jgi:PAS domain S-box-containing protein
MEEAGFGKSIASAFGSASDAARFLLDLSIVVAVYIGLDELVAFLSPTDAAEPLLWPPTGLAIALILLLGYRIWPAILAGSFFPCILAVRSPLESGCIGVGTVAGAFAGAWLISRWSDGRRTFDTPNGVVRFAVVSAASSMIAATIVLPALILTDKPILSESLVSWAICWLGDIAGTLVIAPTVLLWSMDSFRSVSRWRLLESVALFCLVGIIWIVACSPLVSSSVGNHYLTGLLPYRSLLGFLILLPLMWSGLRGNRRDVATAVLIFMGCLAWQLSTGNSPFPDNYPNQAKLLLFVLSICLSVAALAMAAAIMMRQRTEAHLLSVQSGLVDQIAEASLELSSAKRHFRMLIEGVVDYAIFALDKEGHVASWNGGAQKVLGYTAQEIIGKNFGIFYRPDERRAGTPNRALEFAVQEANTSLKVGSFEKTGRRSSSRARSPP